MEKLANLRPCLSLTSASPLRDLVPVVLVRRTTKREFISTQTCRDTRLTSSMYFPCTAFSPIPDTDF